MIMQTFSQWLAHSMIFGSILLLLGAIGVVVFRQPVYRVRIIHWTLTACLLVPLLQSFDVLPDYSLGLLHAKAETSVPMQRDVSSKARQSLTSKEYRESPELLLDPGVQQSQPSVNSDGQTMEQESISSSGVFSQTTPAKAAPWFSVSSLWPAVQVLYLVVVVSMSILWCLALARRSAITRRSCPAKDSSIELLQSIAGTNKLPRLLVSNDIQSPVMWGLARSTIVIPASLENGPPIRLRWGIAHEWAHVLNRDYPTWILATIAKFVCFFQPHYWWLRRQLTLSQDYLADAYATDHGESAEDYAAFLVEMAQGGTSSCSALALGIADSKSNLFRRVRVLVATNVPLLRRANARSVLIIALTGIITVTGFSFLRLGSQAAVAATPVIADENTDGNQKEAADRKAAEEKQLPDPITYVGTVIDRKTGEPIEGVTVEVTHELSRDPKTNQWVTLHTTRHISDKKGKYEFTLPPEEVAESSLYIVVDAHHPNYQSKGRSGYSHSMILTNLEKGEPPFYQTIKLAPGEAIEGQIFNPDGSPAANTRLLTYTKPPSKGGSLRIRGAFQDGVTDEQGNFRMTVATPGDGVLWVYPKEAAPKAIRLRDMRGKLEPIQLDSGKRITGQVLSTSGKPVPNVGVSLRSQSDGEEADDFLSQNSVSRGIRAAAMTDEQGQFQLHPLPAGEYSLRIEDRAYDPTEAREGRKPKRELEHVFSRMKITISDDSVNEPLEIHALPHVIVRGRFFDPTGKPRASHAQDLFGKIDGEFFFTESSRPGDDGWFEFKVPHGAEEVRINTMTNEHGALRWRLKPEDPLSFGRSIDLGTLEEDLTTLEMVRYKAPILLVKIVDKDGKPIDGFKPDTKYIESKEGEKMMGTSFVYGGAVSFEKQPDGRWRSSQMQPDTRLEVTIVENDPGNQDAPLPTSVEGSDEKPKEFHYAAKGQTVSLEEGITKEIVFVMEKRVGKKGDGAADPADAN